MYLGGMLYCVFFFWLGIWIGCEVFVMLIWIMVVLLGRFVNWRGNEFLVWSDMMVEEIRGWKLVIKCMVNGCVKNLRFIR